MTAVVGTLMMLAVTAVAIPLALIFGAPLLRDLKDDAALGKVEGPFEAARAQQFALNVDGMAGKVPFQTGGGLLQYSQGTTFQVSLDKDGSVLYRTCDRKLTGWLDGDGTLTAAAALGTVCRPISNSNNANSCKETVVLGVTVPATAVCVEAQTVPMGGSGAYIGTLGTSVTGALTYGGGGKWSTSAEYHIAMYYWDSTTTTKTYTDLHWIVPTQRLEWTSNSVRLELEHGALLTAVRGPAALTTMPRLAEDAGASEDTLFLRMLRVHGSGAVAGAGGRSLSLEANSTSSLAHDIDAYRVRMQFGNADATAWCQGMMARNTLKQLPAAGLSYREDALAACATGSTEGVRAVVYSQLVPATTFPTEVSLARIEATASI